MNIARAFAKYLEDELSLGTFGTDIFVGGVPLNAPSSCFWIVSNGGSPQTKNKTGEVLKNYVLSVYCRSEDAEGVADTIQSLEETLNGNNCTQLDGYETIDISCISFATDQDLDNEDRDVGLIQVTINVYQS